MKLLLWGKQLANYLAKIFARRIDSSTYSLNELLDGITPENTHGEWDMGAPVGNEVW